MNINNNIHWYHFLYHKVEISYENEYQIDYIVIKKKQFSMNKFRLSFFMFIENMNIILYIMYYKNIVNIFKYVWTCSCYDKTWRKKLMFELFHVMIKHEKNVMLNYKVPFYHVYTKHSDFLVFIYQQNMIIFYRFVLFWL